MKKSLESFVALNRKAFLFFGAIVGLGLFGVVTWQTSASGLVADDTSVRRPQNGIAFTVEELTFPQPGQVREESRTGVPDGGMLANPPRDLTPTEKLGLTEIPAGVKPASTDTRFAPLALQATTTLNYTGALHTYTVPAGLTQLIVEVYGGEGGTGAPGNSGAGPIAAGVGGKRGKATGTLAVTPGQVLNVFVGGSGGSPAGGFNGGASGGNTNAGGGGGASDVRVGGVAEANRVITAGGGGGGGRGGGESR